jgi:hypothetical protein
VRAGFIKAEAFDLVCQVEWMSRRSVDANGSVRQNLNVVDLHSLLVRGADYAAHQTFFELNRVRRHTKILSVVDTGAPTGGASTKGD